MKKKSSIILFLLISGIILIPNFVYADMPVVDKPHTRIYYRGYKMTVKDLLDAAKKYEEGLNRETHKYYPVFPEMFNSDLTKIDLGYTYSDKTHSIDFNSYKLPISNETYYNMTYNAFPKESKYFNRPGDYTEFGWQLLIDRYNGYRQFTTLPGIKGDIEDDKVKEEREKAEQELKQWLEKNESIELDLSDDKEVELKEDSDAYQVFLDLLKKDDPTFEINKSFENKKLMVEAYEGKEALNISYDSKEKIIRIKKDEEHDENIKELTINPYQIYDNEDLIRNNEFINEILPIFGNYEDTVNFLKDYTNMYSKKGAIIENISVRDTKVSNEETPSSEVMDSYRCDGEDIYYEPIIAIGASPYYWQEYLEFIKKDKTELFEIMKYADNHYYLDEWIAFANGKFSNDKESEEYYVQNIYYGANNQLATEFFSSSGMLQKFEEDYLKLLELSSNIPTDYVENIDNPTGDEWYNDYDYYGNDSILLEYFNLHYIQDKFSFGYVLAYHSKDNLKYRYEEYIKGIKKAIEEYGNEINESYPGAKVDLNKLKQLIDTNDINTIFANYLDFYRINERLFGYIPAEKMNENACARDVDNAEYTSNIFLTGVRIIEPEVKLIFYKKSDDSITNPSTGMNFTPIIFVLFVIIISIYFYRNGSKRVYLNNE